MHHSLRLSLTLLFLLPAVQASAGDVKDTDVYARLKASLDAVPAIDTHSHLGGPVHIQRAVQRGSEGQRPANCELNRLWSRSYYVWAHPLAPWPEDGRFETWWTAAKKNFDNSRARSAYRSLLPIFSDLYGVDFETLTVEQAKDLNDRMERNHANPDWAEEVLVKRANTELILVDAFCFMPRAGEHTYPFQAYACHVRWLISGFHPSELANFPAEDPYRFAQQHNLPVESLDDYVAVVDRVLAEAKKAGAVCLKSPIAYNRTLKFNWVPKERAEQAFGKTRDQLTPAQIKDFQDYMFWQLAALSAKHALPFQIHTGHAMIESSNPMNLVNLIQANPKTTFVLFHGGFPWVGESGMVALKYPNVYLDSVWMPTLSHTIGKRAFNEWLDMISSNRIMWGSDTGSIEGTYGLTIYARQCITEALAEKVVAKELREQDALRIGRQILRENALEAYPLLRERVKKTNDQ
ncbi:MAG: amidohydrolase family protein [Pirellulaceae bacterium]|nr:amidohydrolase family protein [Pirellulaceae bacterium]